MFNTFNFMAINRCCILGGPYYPTLPYIHTYIHTYLHTYMYMHAYVHRGLHAYIQFIDFMYMNL